MKEEKMGLIDTPIDSIKNDGLGVLPYVKSLAKLIELCDTPMTISIQGNWGSGKTSFMKMVKEKLVETDRDYRIVEFNTWQYSKFNLDDVLAVSFLDSFANSIISDSTYEQKTKIKKALKSLTFSTLGMLTNGIVSPSIENILSDEPVLSVADQITELKIQLEEAVSKLVKEKKYERIIIFIDDLDRLHPSKAVDLLEVLQLFLTIKNCVFVLAVDYEVVIQGVKNKMGEQHSNEKARNFFDKIIQLPFSIPIGTNNEIEEYVGNLLGNIPNLEINTEEKKSYVDIINKTVQFNPRNIKRVMNAYWLLLLVISEKEETKLSFKKNHINLALFTVLCMQLAYEPMYIEVLKLLGNDENEEVASFLNNKISEKEFVQSLDIELETTVNDINIKRCLEFTIEFKKIFSSESYEGFELLKYVMTLSQSTSNENLVEDSSTIAAVMIRSHNKIDMDKLKDILNEKYSGIISTIETIYNDKTVVVKFKEVINRSYRAEIKSELVANQFDHYMVTAHKYDYFRDK